jgi:transcriptional regulator with XRE-family HTH domain
VTGNDLRIRRKRLGVSLEVQAAKLGMDESLLAKVERGSRRMKDGLPDQYEAALRDILQERAASVGLQLIAA